MEENEYAHINKYIDQLPMFLNWEFDTVIYAISGMASLVLLDGIFGYLIFFGGFAMSFFTEKLKNTKYRNYIKHVFYMYGLVKPKKLPPSYQRYFLA